MTIEVIQTQVGGLAAPVGSASVKYLQFQEQVDGSSKAQEINMALSGAKLNIGVLLINNDAGFDSMYIPPKALEGDSALKRFDGGVAVLNIESILKITGVALPIGVSLMHELGHAKQYVEKPEWFTNQFLAATQKGSKEAQLAIENDNVQRHEKPICVELGKPHRDKYD